MKGLFRQEVDEIGEFAKYGAYGGHGGRFGQVRRNGAAHPKSYRGLILLED